MPVPPIPVPPNQHPVVDMNRHATLPWIMFWTAMQSASSSGFAPSDAEYLVGAADGSLPNERVVVNSVTNVWNLAVANQASVARAALTGDITAPFDSNVTTLSTTGVTPGTYGDATHVGQFTVDAKGRLSFATDVAISAAPLTATFLTATDETAILTNSRELLAGTGVSFDDTTPGQRTINVTATGADYVVAGDGVQPPTPIDNGAGEFVYVIYTP